MLSMERNAWGKHQRPIPQVEHSQHGWCNFSDFKKPGVAVVQGGGCQGIQLPEVAVQVVHIIQDLLLSILPVVQAR